MHAGAGDCAEHALGRGGFRMGRDGERGLEVGRRWKVDTEIMDDGIEGEDDCLQGAARTSPCPRGKECWPKDAERKRLVQGFLLGEQFCGSLYCPRYGNHIKENDARVAFAEGGDGAEGLRAKPGL